MTVSAMASETQLTFTSPAPQCRWTHRAPLGGLECSLACSDLCPFVVKTVRGTVLVLAGAFPSQMIPLKRLIILIFVLGESCRFRNHFLFSDPYQSLFSPPVRIHTTVSRPISSTCPLVSGTAAGIQRMPDMGFGRAEPHTCGVA